MILVVFDEFNTLLTSNQTNLFSETYATHFGTNWHETKPSLTGRAGTQHYYNSLSRSNTTVDKWYRRPSLVSICLLLRYSMSTNGRPLKSELGVTQSYWKLHDSIDHVRLPIVCHCKSTQAFVGVVAKMGEYTVFRKKHPLLFSCVTLRKVTNLNDTLRQNS